MRKILLLWGILLVTGLSAWSQSRQITGTITEKSTKEPLIGVSVVVKGTTVGTQTDVNGRFKLSVPANAVLTIRYVGYKPQEISVGSRNEINAALENDAVQLNEVVAVGFATVRRRDLTGSVSSVTAKDLKDIPLNSAGAALAGRLAGVQVNQSEGSPDAQIQIRVRGGGSITQDNSPLYIIDGIQVENGLSNISPQDIESIDVLKDAASTAIYGARGANGVVIITTKGGHEMKTTVSYNAFVGINKLAKELAVMSPYDFVVYQYERNRFTADSTNFINDYGSTFAGLSTYKNTPAIDWQKLALGRTGFQQTHNLSITGGTKVTQFNFSFTDNQQNGTVLNSDYNRKLISFRFDHTASDHLKVGFNVRYNTQVVDGAGTSNSTISSSGTSNSASSSSYSNLRNSVKYRPFSIPGVDDSAVDPAYLAETNAAGNNYGIINPVVNASAQYRKTLTNVTNFNGYGNYTFNKYLSFRSTLGVDYNNQKQNSFDDAITANARVNGAGQPLAGVISVNTNTLDLSNVLTFSNAAANPKHGDLNLILGNEFYNTHAESLNNQFKLFPTGVAATDALNQLNLGTIVTTYPQVTNITSHLLSFFTRANYNYDKKYLLQATLRADGSSKFDPGHQWGYFPSGSAAWRISDENFMKNIKALSNLKLRLSYGTSGNNRISDYLTQTTFNANALYSLNESTTSIGFSTPYLANPNLKWETTVSKNIGLDFGFLNDRIQVSFDAYRNVTKDLLLLVNIPASSGYTTQYQNVGKTQNQGIEAQVNATIIQKKNFSWSANFNASYNENKVLALASGQNYYLQSSGYGPSGTPEDFIVQVGKPVGSAYGYVNDGFYQVSDFNYNTTTKQYTLKAGVVDPSKVIGVAEPGLVKYKDINGDGVITTADRTVLGNTIPKVTGGLNQQFTFKHFDFSAFVNFQAGSKVLNANKIEFSNGYTSNTNLLAAEANRWRTIDGNGNQVEYISGGYAVGIAPDALAALNANAKTSIPVTGSSAFYSTSNNLEDASFIRINNLTLGYTINPAFLRRIKVSKLRVYATANNVAIITSYSGYDPDVSTRRATGVTPGVDYSAYPRSRTYLLGVNLSL
ncbi:SusC/RagA family TonB-linked outer membrane protein [Mucilaginibacter arboris]|uniref:SusC/RagA family TonB-linked outer membrane protein n=1 Tax=Mucilaginibacter arboris TaxID=2682090 RepID=A0A7K1SVH5_9SPHI|nr:TonB-dependent receptor [Mucilaginibacter arboris]MVN21342.1 SusC/RagA family TonB-linked outer membrane protein [Mucilaginibacter arboris]